MSLPKTAGYVFSTMRLRASLERGFADHGWLKSYHTFSFASYHDPKYEGFGDLRVINEDTVAGGEGFPTHGHRNFEIFSYVLSGALEHKDSMGTKEVLRRGEIQLTTAGSGIAHSEYNAHPSEPVRFLQIWVKPDAMGLTPRYQTGMFEDASKVDTLKLVISPDGRGGSLSIHQDFFMYASLLHGGATVEHDLGPRRAYLHVPIMGPATDFLTINGVRVGQGDGLFIDGEEKVTITATTASTDATVEFVLFSLK